MASSGYELGANFERRVIARLSKDGYECFRSAGSRGKIDIVAIKPGQILLIQCKRSGEIEREEWNAVYAISRRLQPSDSGRRVVLPLVAYMPGRSGIAYKHISAPAAHRARRLFREWSPEDPS